MKHHRPLPELLRYLWFGAGGLLISCALLAFPEIQRGGYFKQGDWFEVLAELSTVLSLPFVVAVIVTLVPTLIWWLISFRREPHSASPRMSTGRTSGLGMTFLVGGVLLIAIGVIGITVLPLGACPSCGGAGVDPQIRFRSNLTVEELRNAFPCT